MKTETTLLLALAAPLLASPVRRDVTVRYSASYANAPTPRQPLPQKDGSEVDDPLTNEWDGILAEEKPIPTSVLMNMGKLLGEEPDKEGEMVVGEKAGVSEKADAADLVRGQPKASAPMGFPDVRASPVVALLAFSTLGLMACAIQRWRKPRGEIYLSDEEPKQYHEVSKMP